MAWKKSNYHTTIKQSLGNNFKATALNVSLFSKGNKTTRFNTHAQT